MHNQLSATWTADWGTLPDEIIAVIEENQEDFGVSEEKTVEIWANLFQEAGMTVRALQGFYDPGFTVDKAAWAADRFAFLANQDDKPRAYWLEVDGYLIDPTGARSLDNYYPYWFWPKEVFDDFMWREDWEPLD